MMMAPEQYVEQFEKFVVSRNLKSKKWICFWDFEVWIYDREESDWESSTGSDVGYQLNVELPGLLAPLLKESFNKEYEWGEKDMDEYGREMRKVSRNNNN